jgi:hypothetical protein
VGILANSLELGCDCKGEIRYFDAAMVTTKGEPYLIKVQYNIHSSYTHYTLNIHSTYTHHTLIIHSSYTHHTLIIHSSYTHHTLIIPDQARGVYARGGLRRAVEAYGLSDGEGGGEDSLLIARRRWRCEQSIYSTPCGGEDREGENSLLIAHRVEVSTVY